MSNLGGRGREGEKREERERVIGRKEREGAD
jgi:hypothetical protein